MSDEEKMKCGTPSSPPLFKNLSFWWYSERLRMEFAGRIAEEIQEALREAGISKPSVHSLWLTAPIVPEEKDGGNRSGQSWGGLGFWTDNSLAGFVPPKPEQRIPTSGRDEYFVTPAYLLTPTKARAGKTKISLARFLRHALRTGKAEIKYKEMHEKVPNESELRAALELREVESIYSKVNRAYPVEPSWDSDYIAQADALSVDLRDLQKRSELEAALESGTASANFHPRDAVIGLGYQVVVPAWDRQSAASSMTTIAWRQPKAEKSVWRKCSFEDGIDLPARAVLQAVAASKSRMSWLVLLPVPSGSDGQFNSILAFCLCAGKGFDLVNSLLSDAAAGEIIGEQLSTFATYLGNCPVVVDALDQLNEAHRQRHSELKRYISSFEQEQLVNANFTKDRKILRSLNDRIETEINQGHSDGIPCPFRLPLESLSYDILTAMRSLLAHVKMGYLAPPLMKFLEYEQGLFGDGDERDHYFHTMKVMLLGRLLLGKTLYTNMRDAWIVSALFHDVCYPIQTADKWIVERLKAIFPADVENRSSIEKYLAGWDGRGYESCWFDILLRLVDRRLREWTRMKSVRFSSLATFSLVSNRNHGIVAAASLLTWAQKHAESLAKSGRASLPDMDKLFRGKEHPMHQVVFDAATAIALHDPGIWRALPAGFDFNNANGHSRRVAKLSWTLAYVDCVQEWGRNVDTVKQQNAGPDAIDPNCWTPFGVTLDDDAQILSVKYEEGLSNALKERLEAAVGHVDDCLNSAGCVLLDDLMDNLELKEDEERRLCSARETGGRSIQMKVNDGVRNYTNPSAALRSLHGLWLLCGEEEVDGDLFEVGMVMRSIDNVQEQVRALLVATNYQKADEKVAHFMREKLRKIVRCESKKRAESNAEIKRLRKKVKSVYGFLQFPRDLRRIWGTLAPRGTNITLQRKIGEVVVNEL